MQKSYVIGHIEGWGEDEVRYLQETATFCAGDDESKHEPLICFFGASPRDGGGCLPLAGLIKSFRAGSRGLAAQLFDGRVGAWFLPLAERLVAGERIEEAEIDEAHRISHGGLPVRQLDMWEIFSYKGVLNWLRRLDSLPPTLVEPPPLPREIAGVNERLYGVAETHGQIALPRSIPPGQQALQAACYLTAPDATGCQSSLLLSRHQSVCTVTFPWQLSVHALSELEADLRRAGFRVIPFGFFIASSSAPAWQDLAAALQTGAPSYPDGPRLVYHEDLWRRFFDFI